jgi:iron transport multicopper oxidase
VNNATFQDPSVPVLLQILSGAKSAQELVPAGSIYGLTRGDVVELTIPAGAAGGPVSLNPIMLFKLLKFCRQHAVHLHGHTFYVVRSAGNSTYNWVDPILRDVVSIGSAGDEVTIRFVADNPGPWFFHCHIDWHLNL